MNDMMLSISALWRLYGKQILTTSISLSIVAAGCSAWYFLASPNAIAKSKAKEIIKRSLVDPESAVFEDVVFSAKSGTVFGRVNAKNRMGGYTGMKNFVVDQDGKVTFF